MKVIGAGLPTTGTLSLRKALKILGFGPVYHLAELLEIPENWSTHLTFKDTSEFGKSHVGGIHDCHKFLKAHRARRSKDKKEVKKQLHSIFKDYESALDFPANLFYKELADVYPEAKIILTVTDTSLVYAKRTVLNFGNFRLYVKSFVHRLASCFHGVIPRPFTILLKEIVDPDCLFEKHQLFIWNLA